jgi:hypothetical protein
MTPFTQIISNFLQAIEHEQKRLCKHLVGGDGHK